jgi:predicted Zn-dependent protease
MTKAAKAYRSPRSRLIALFLVSIMAAPQLLEARVQPTHGFDLFSADQELQEGKQAADETNKQLPMLSDSDPVTKYVQQLGAKLAANAPGEKWPYNFHVVNQKEINAFALPGGPVYVNLGTIQAADNESQLAGVMAHEISHIVQRHSTRMATKQMEAQVPLQILAGFLGRGLGGQLAALGIQFAAGSYFLKNSRQAEREADLLGTDIMYDTGYDPHAMAQFFEKIKQQYPSSAPQFLSDHPDPGNRIQYVSAEVNMLAPKRWISGGTEFAQVHQRALGMKAYTADQIAAMQKQSGTAQGISAAETEPSSSFRQFQHSAYSIQYPENWQLSGDANSAVTIAPPSGVTQNGVAYGVIIDGFQPESVSSLDAATHELVARLRQGNPQLKQVGNDQDIKVNGVAAKSVDLLGVSPLQDANGKPERERDWLVALPATDGQQVLYAVFVAPDDQSGKAHATFESMLRTLHLH